MNKDTAIKLFEEKATVQKAILMSSGRGATGNGCVSLAGTPINWTGSAAGTSFSFTNYWADVTGIVASQMNSAPAGISNLTVTECNSGSNDGEALLVVFNDATATEKTVIIMFGAATPAGDNFSVTLAEPINPAAPGALLDMGLGIGFSYQGPSGTGQVSQISVNGTRLTSSAGGEDDGAGANGALITVGGIDDSNANPANPYGGSTSKRTDDELYNILPFINNATTTLNINTVNPSGDDNIFLAYFALSGASSSSTVPAETATAVKALTASVTDNGDAETLKVVIAPNPSSSDFKLQIRSNSDEAVTIQIIDMSGKIIKTVNKVSKGQNVSVGSAFKAGVYFAEVKQGNKKAIVKLVKL